MKQPVSDFTGHFFLIPALKMHGFIKQTISRDWIYIHWFKGAFVKWTPKNGWFHETPYLK